MKSLDNMSTFSFTSFPLELCRYSCELMLEYSQYVFLLKGTFSISDHKVQ